jgi:hypothetical protein
MSETQTRLETGTQTRYYRSIVKDGNVTREDGKTTRAELAVWMVKSAELGQASQITTKVGGSVQYKTILEVALGRRQVDGVTPTTAEDLSRRTGLSTYADSQGGRSASTIKGYLYNDTLSRLNPGQHPVTRVLRRYIRSQKFGHFADGDSDPEAAEPIDIERLFGAFRLAKMICIGEPL